MTLSAHPPLAHVPADRGVDPRLGRGVLQIFRTYEREPRARQIAQMVVSVVNLTRAALVSAQPELRRELLVDLSEREGIEIYPSEPDERLDGPPDDRPVLRLAIAEIRRQLGAETRVAFAARRRARRSGSASASRTTSTG